MRNRLGYISTATLALGIAAISARGDVLASERTADLPDSWLVLYNLNDADSVTWRDWYIAQWSIPAENTLGLDVSAVDERIQFNDFEADIYDAVVAHLAANPDLEAKIMGILVGYRVPGNTYIDGTHPTMQGGGGWSVASNLCDLNKSDWFKRLNPHSFAASYQSPHDQLTKATLNTGFYLTARIDAPTLAEAQALTARARAITLATDPLPADDAIYYDYADVGASGGDEWVTLKNTIVDDDFTDAERYPWLEFESETDATPDCAARLSYYRVSGWHGVDWGGSPAGTRIFGFALNSFGATTVRSTTGLGGRYVPNALFNGGFAAAFGATAEPFVGNEPQPSTVLWCLADGRTLAEASFHANPYVNYMWEVVGDPLLRVPFWFGETPAPDPDVDIQSATYNVDESDASVTVVVELSASSDETVEVDCATLDGTALAGSDYTAAATTLTFAPGEVQQSFVVSLLQDDTEESDESFSVMLSSPVNAVLAGVNDPAEIVIADDDDSGVGGGGGGSGSGGGGGGGDGDDFPPPMPDEDEDGVADDDDNCVDTANANQEDTDDDGIGDACDGCPSDAAKSEPGLCGCGMAEVDSDGDEIEDCLDGCPLDPAKLEPGACGCGEPEDCELIDPSAVDEEEIPTGETPEDIVDADTNGDEPTTTIDDDLEGDDDVMFETLDTEDDSSTNDASTTEEQSTLCGGGMGIAMLMIPFVLLSLRVRNRLE